MSKRTRRIIKKQKRLIVIALCVVAVGVLGFGIKWITPILMEHLGLVQDLQRMRTPSSKQNALTLFLLVCLAVAVYIICKCIHTIIYQISWKISWNHNKRVREWEHSQDLQERIQAFAKEDQEERELRESLFREMTEEFPTVDETGLWDLLKEMSAVALKEARDERHQRFYIR